MLTVSQTVIGLCVFYTGYSVVNSLPKLYNLVKNEYKKLSQGRY